MSRKLLFALALLGWSGLFLGSAAAAASGLPPIERPSWSIGLGFDYAAGDYGTASRSEFLSIPLYLDLYPSERLDLQLIVPYLYQSVNPGDGTILFPTQGAAVGTPRGRKNGVSGGTSALLVNDSRRSESGLGDITLTAGYLLVDDGPGSLQLRPTVYVKFPTADQAQGLGTGEFDFGPGLTLGKWLGDWQLFAEGSYVVQGDSARYATQDYVAYNAGVGRQLRASFYGALQALGATAPARGAEAALEGRLKGVWWLATDLSLEGYVGTGFDDGGADFTSGLAVFFAF